MYQTFTSDSWYINNENTFGTSRWQQLSTSMEHQWPPHLTANRLWEHCFYTRPTQKSTALTTVSLLLTKWFHEQEIICNIFITWVCSVLKMFLVPKVRSYNILSQLKGIFIEVEKKANQQIHRFKKVKRVILLLFCRCS